MLFRSESTSDDRVLNQLSKLHFAYFAGGNPLYLAETLAGSRAWQALVERWRDGMGLGGSSAGAMVLNESIFLRERWADALGLVPRTVTLPHFNRRDEAAIERARVAVTSRGFVGLGIDESTALVWTSDTGWRVAGPGSVWVLSAEGSARYARGCKPDGVPEPGA